MNNKTQKEQFSDKKSHNIKNVAIAATYRKVLFLSKTYEGSVQDKRIANEAAVRFEETVELLQSIGFQRFRPVNIVLFSLKETMGINAGQKAETGK